GKRPGALCVRSRGGAPGPRHRRARGGPAVPDRPAVVGERADARVGDVAPSFKTQLFRFVDVFPATVDDADVLRHLDEYFEEAEAPRLVDVGLDVADHVPFGRTAAASVARRNIRRLAQQFIVGADAARADV